MIYILVLTLTCSTTVLRGRTGVDSPSIRRGIIMCDDEPNSLSTQWIGFSRTLLVSRKTAFDIVAVVVAEFAFVVHSHLQAAYCTMQRVESKSQRARGRGR
ncbi:hypothetical protein BC629DRAFT_1523046 [Irpex lacteus]|nr:hypothetical protein BC629DRAFT_1523046 [Irpex lacteus]